MTEDLGFLGNRRGWQWGGAAEGRGEGLVVTEPGERRGGHQCSREDAEEADEAAVVALAEGGEASGEGYGVAAEVAAGEMESEDLMPMMAEKLEAEEFLRELCGVAGGGAVFWQLVDPERGLITGESLRRNAAALGMEGMTAEDAAVMVREGDLDGHRTLHKTNFYILMVRLGPGMMEDAEAWLDKAIARELTKPFSV
ncbi:calcium-binding protein KIC-like [Elaeis guineensis]|uniref:calcium-binding protein KIC-like n=1 Tax=Elaeis guineensis var. tenera TaxID=51953 RepID=UPI003C6CEFE1